MNLYLWKEYKGFVKVLKSEKFQIELYKDQKSKFKPRKVKIYFANRDNQVLINKTFDLLYK